MPDIKIRISPQKKFIGEKRFAISASTPGSRFQKNAGCWDSNPHPRPSGVRGGTPKTTWHKNFPTKN